MGKAINQPCLFIHSIFLRILEYCKEAKKKQGAQFNRKLNLKRKHGGWFEVQIFLGNKLHIIVHDQLGLGVAFFATGLCLGIIMYILTTLEFRTHYFDFHLLTTSVNAKYYFETTVLMQTVYSHVIQVKDKDED